MADGKQFTVYGENGLKGTMFANARFLDDNAERVIRLDNGQELKVPASALEPRSDGSFYLRTVQRDAPVNGDSVNGTASKSESVLNGPVFRQGYDVERVNVERLLDEAPSERHEGDALILPVVEEVLVVEKKYLLKEEIWIRKKREQVSQPQTVRRGNGAK